MLLLLYCLELKFFLLMPLLLFPHAEDMYLIKGGMTFLPDGSFAKKNENTGKIGTKKPTRVQFGAFNSEKNLVNFFIFQLFVCLKMLQLA